MGPKAIFGNKFNSPAPLTTGQDLKRIMLVNAKKIVALILLAFSCGLSLGHGFSFIHDESFKTEVSCQPSTSRINERDVLFNKTSTASNYSTGNKVPETSLSSSLQNFSKSTYTYTDAKKVENLLNRLFQNIEDGNEIRILAAVGSPEIVAEIKAMALDSSKPAHIRAASIIASDWQTDTENLIMLAKQESDPFLLDSIIATLDETEMSSDERALANQTVLNACNTGDERVLTAARTYFSDKQEDLSKLLTFGYNREIPHDVSKWLLENVSWEDNPSAMNNISTSRKDF